MIKAVIFDMYETLITHYRSPLYFGAHMAADAGIAEADFLKYWRPTEEARSVGNLTTEEAIELVLRENDCYSAETLEKIMQRRIAAKKACFEQLHKEILPLLQSLKEKGILIGLISNCFSEEARVIRESILFPYFDAAYLSFEQKVQKPNPMIFERCMSELGVTAKECLYVGDGGSNELQAAEKLGMKALQATWYLQEGTNQPTSFMKEYRGLRTPLDVLNYLN